jgi:TM2 domain-containing membrane protein YozV
MRRLLHIVFTLMLVHSARSMEAQQFSESFAAQVLLNQDDNGYWRLNERIAQSENPRLVAIALDVSLGLFGVHRMYLGTDVKVPIAYTLTFGGGGVIWLVDLALLIASPSIETYKNNPHFFMWIPKQ